MQVIDLDLRLADVEAQGLEAEAVGDGRSDPSDNLAENGATDEEIAFLYDGNGSGQGVELIAFASDALIAWIEEKLAEHGIAKVLPDAEELAAAYRRALHVEMLRQAVQALNQKAATIAREREIPEDLAETIREALEDDPMLAWDAAIIALAQEASEEHEIVPLGDAGEAEAKDSAC